MLSDKEFQEIVKNLQNTNVMERSYMLQALQGSPCNDERILPYLEELTKDKACSTISVPHQYAEIRWLAIHVLAQEMKALGINEPVRFYGIGMPLKLAQLGYLEDKYNIKTTASDKEPLFEAYEELMGVGKVPVVDITLNHPDPNVKEYVFHNLEELDEANK